MKWDIKDQAHANWIAFLTSSEYDNRREALSRFSKAMQEEHATWCLSCSANLFFRGLVDDFNDFDVLIDMESVEASKRAMTRIGGKLPNTVQKQYFTSPFYQEAMYGDAHFDLVGDMTVATFGTEYMYQVKNEEIEWVNLNRNIHISLCPVEANLLLYGMMEGWQTKRRFKRNICFEYLKNNGIEYRNVLENALSCNIPGFLREVVATLLEALQAKWQKSLSEGNLTLLF